MTIYPSIYLSGCLAVFQSIHPSIINIIVYFLWESGLLSNEISNNLMFTFRLQKGCRSGYKKWADTYCNQIIESVNWEFRRFSVKKKFKNAHNLTTFVMLLWDLFFIHFLLKRVSRYSAKPHILCSKKETTWGRVNCDRIWIVWTIPFNGGLQLL